MLLLIFVRYDRRLSWPEHAVDKQLVEDYCNGVLSYYLSDAIGVVFVLEQQRQRLDVIFLGGDV